ncbi:peroxiredoxin family protein [Fulvivirga sedimenti]|uniref:TlpA family protein disulfide reductase n=1 Tax=Fulvivirga sedimenti TaxID=2879465 RepID=A0A9X1HYP1_9BACT|nr:TlpA disulfide reductase family protein [Fulvivirga sedimenti]MCA6079137.1 TlpA family protein disulfide reductase [Fulvivirga sedimenti]
MKKMNILLVAVAILYSCSSESNSQESNGRSITLTGRVVNPQQNGHIILSRYLNQSGGTEVLDTLSLNSDKTFEERVNVPAAGYYKLDFYGRQVVNLILDNDDVEVNVDGQQPQGYAEVNGSSDHDFIQGAQMAVQQFQQSAQVRSLNEAFVAAQQQNDSEAMDSLRLRYMEMDFEFKSQLLKSADTMETSLGVVEILKNKQFIDPDQHFEYMKSYAARVEKDMGDSPIAMEFVDNVKAMEVLSIGAVAPEISLPNPDGDIVPLSSLRGKYVLVDFWAQWCRPCRMENPNVVAVYQQYNDLGFEVYGVSLDRTREKWLQAIEEDGLHWTQVSDLKFWNSEAARTYGITAIPFSILLDPEGRIIGKNLRGAALRQKLAEIFDNKG